MAFQKPTTTLPELAALGFGSISAAAIGLAQCVHGAVPADAPPLSVKIEGEAMQERRCAAACKARFCCRAQAGKAAEAGPGEATSTHVARGASGQPTAQCLDRLLVLLHPHRS